MPKVQNLRGTRDFYPDKMGNLNRIFSIWREVCVKYGYEEYEGPILESSQLWRMKSGNEIPEQMYAFLDKSGDEIAIRPEMTPTLARMVAERQKELPKPIRWFSLPRCFRYEAPQKGRLREFFQLNVDLLGSTSMRSDAEVIATAIDIMRAFGCDANDFYVRLGNRKIISAMLTLLGIDNVQETCRAIDKMDKMEEKEFLKALTLCTKSELKSQKIVSLITAKDPSITFNALRSMDGSEETKALLEIGIAELTQLVMLLEAYAPKEYVVVDFTIMRGFDYYTSTVFEIFDRKKEFRAIAGGGRYDNLVGDFGGEPCPGIGYGMGDASLELFLTQKGLMPQYQKSVEYLVIPINEAMDAVAVKIAQRLRKDASVEVEITGKNLRKALGDANERGVQNVVIVGPRDVEQGKVTIRNLKTGEETTLAL